MKEEKPLFDHHPHDIPCRETARVTDEIPQIAQITQNDGNRDNPKCGLKEAQYPCGRLPSADDKQHPERIERHVADAQTKDDQRHDGRRDSEKIEHGSSPIGYRVRNGRRSTGERKTANATASAWGGAPGGDRRTPAVISPSTLLFKLCHA